jgi:molybdopterin molybdotransferase
LRAGEVVVPAGTILGPAHLGVLASVGWVEPRIFQPRVEILSTGDELVDPERVPLPGKIRNSNAAMLEALVQQDRAMPLSRPIIPDDPRDLLWALAHALDGDVVLITGGVSAGQRDLVPGALEAVGVRRVFHKVRLKPGKPIWFGVERADTEDEPGSGRGGRPGALVFGLPGNPVSVLVGYLLFVRPALAILSQRPGPPPAARPARLARPFRHRGDRPTYYPARQVLSLGGTEPPEIETLDWAGSADLRTVASADGFAAFPAGDRDYNPGEIVDFLPMR